MGRKQQKAGQPKGRNMNPLSISTGASLSHAGEDGGDKKGTAASTRGATFRSEGKRYGIKPAKSGLVGGSEGKAPSSKSGNTAGGKRYGMDPATSNLTK